jgi:hypothetical protein
MLFRSISKYYCHFPSFSDFADFSFAVSWRRVVVCRAVMFNRFFEFICYVRGFVCICFFVPVFVFFWVQEAREVATRQVSKNSFRQVCQLYYLFWTSFFFRSLATPHTHHRNADAVWLMFWGRSFFLFFFFSFFSLFAPRHVLKERCNTSQFSVT